MVTLTGENLEQSTISYRHSPILLCNITVIMWHPLVALRMNFFLQNKITAKITMTKI